VESRCLFGHLAGSASLELLLFIPALVFSRQGNRAITSRDNRIATYCGMKSWTWWRRPLSLTNWQRPPHPMRWL